ncbi:MAG: hypothetical protein OJF51_003956 [Nitrospira sp.]|nr:MAG: hypothetical protein OJF51_003956 [Nitrospira sp.]
MASLSLIRWTGTDHADLHDAAWGRRRDRVRLFGMRGWRGAWCSMAARRMRFSRV